MLSIENDGQAILRSNYWDTPLNESGTIAISMNAGAFRILLPDSMVDQVAEMLTAREVIVSKGHYQARRAYEILFDDHTDSPYSLMVDARQFASLQPEDREPGSRSGSGGRSECLRCPPGSGWCGGSRACNHGENDGDGTTPQRGDAIR